VILLIDNYDSFAANLGRYLQQLGQTVRSVRNDELDAAELRAAKPSALILSPGPCTPSEAGNALDIVRQLHAELPMLGVCLGHQTIAAALGGRIVRAAQPMHGRASIVEHTDRGIFAGLPNPLTAGRYHSLIVERPSLPSCFEISAQTGDGTIMALAHRELPIVGVQFHPESILTEHGYAVLAGFLRLAGLKVPDILPQLENAGPLKPQHNWPDVPLTF